MTAPTSTSPQRSQTLLAITIKTLVIFATVIFTVLNALGWLHERDFANMPEADKNRYVNARLVKALETFETAILSMPENTTRSPAMTSAQLLQGVPECRSAWDDAPGAMEQWIAKLRGQPMNSSTTADRLVGKLAALESYLIRQGSSGNRRLQHPVALNGERWFEAARLALKTPVRIKLPQGDMAELKMDCANLSAAVRKLVPESCRQALLVAPGADADHRVQKECRALENLSWRETTVPSVTRDFLPHQQIGVPDNLIAQRNPWSGVPGCVFWRSGEGKAGALFYKSDSRKGNHRVCENKDVAGIGKKESVPLVAVAGTPNNDTLLDDPRWSVPPSLDLILRPLEALRLPGSQLYHDYTGREARNAKTPESYGYGPNTASIGGSRLDVGFSVDLAIDPVAQAYAQQVAACYTGAQQICRKLGIHRTEDRGKGGKGKEQPLGHRLQENAVVRMVGIAIIDIASGRIEAAAGSLSPCARQDNDGPGRGPECDKRLPWEPAFRPDQLENPALFQDAMPASTVKPIMAAAFLTDGVYGERLLAQELAAEQPKEQPLGGLRHELMRSNSARFLDRMFCSEKGYADCQRPWHIQSMASALGWNTACTDRADCGQRDVLFGRAPDNTGENGLVVPSARMALFGRLLVEPLGENRDSEDWRFHLMPRRDLNVDLLKKCRKGKDKDDDDDWRGCRAGYTGKVVHEGWGQENARASALGVASMMAMLGASANGAASMPAPHLVERLRGTGNTPLLTAEQRFALAPPLPVKVPPQAAQVIFSGLNWSHRGGTAASACQQLWGATTCMGIDWIAGKTGTPSFHNDNKTLDAIAKECLQGKCSSQRPYKWYTGVFRLDNGRQWHKAIAVLTERNWLRGNGTVHGAGDHGPNPAAEIALQVAHCLRENPTGKDKAACRD